MVKENGVGPIKQRIAEFTGHGAAHGNRGFDPQRLTIAMLGVVLCALFTVAAYLALDVQGDLAMERSDSNDSFSWTVFQLETDYLRLINSFDRYLRARADERPLPDEYFDDLRKRFDIFYSRIGVVVVAISSRSGGVDPAPFTDMLLENRDRWAAGFDRLAVDHRTADWGPLYRSLTGASRTVREGMLGALDAIIDHREQERRALLEHWEHYIAIIILMLALIASGLVGTFFILRRLRKQRSDLTALSLAFETQSVTDPLTGLFTRRVLERLFPDEDSDKDIALIAYDIDDFKCTNEVWGHAAGDRLLSSVAASIREAAGADAIAIRLGGEEFAVVAEWSGWRAAKQMDQRIHDAVSEQLVVASGTTIRCTVSGGIAKLAAGDAVASGLGWADEALRMAKRTGKNRTCYADDVFFSDRMMGGSVVTPLSVQAALTSGEIRFFVQPIVSLTAGGVVGYEALIRWVDPDGVVHPPSVFRDEYKEVTEYPEGFRFIESNLIRLLGELQESAGKFISLNLGLEFIHRDENLDHLIRLSDEIRARFDCRLVVELSEASSSISLTQGQLRSQAERLTGSSVDLALDDFGREASNLDRIADLPISMVKLDKKLIAELAVNRRAEAVVAGLLAMMAQLSLRVVAEGVESVDQAQRLRRMGLSEHQGYAYATPVPAETMNNLHADIEGMITDMTATPAG